MAAAFFCCADPVQEVGSSNRSTVRLTLRICNYPHIVVLARTLRRERDLRDVGDGVDLPRSRYKKLEVPGIAFGFSESSRFVSVCAALSTARRKHVKAGGRRVMAPSAVR